MCSQTSPKEFVILARSHFFFFLILVHSENKRICFFYLIGLRSFHSARTSCWTKSNTRTKKELFFLNLHVFCAFPFYLIRASSVGRNSKAATRLYHLPLLDCFVLKFKKNKLCELFNWTKKNLKREELFCATSKNDPVTLLVFDKPNSKEKREISKESNRKMRRKRVVVFFSQFQKRNTKQKQKKFGC